jgi:hypothetical protein
MSAETIRPEQRVRVTQTIRTRDGDWTTRIEGLVISIDVAPTGSWYTHGKNGKLWLRRLRLERDDGEITDLVLDGESVVTLLS